MNGCVAERQAQKKMQSERSQTPGKICPSCHGIATKSEWFATHQVCSFCGYHDKLSFEDRVRLLCQRVEYSLGEDLLSQNWLNFFDQKSYVDRLKVAKKLSKNTEALSVFIGTLEEYSAVYAVFDFDFIAGSMSSAVGERFLLAVRAAIEKRYPLICYATSGGARMQEGVYSLIQMKRTATALALLSQEKLPYIVIQGSPCMGGVTASLASLGDLHLAEPGALIGFSGPRVIAQTVAKTLPKGFQTSEFLLKNGFVDQIVSRSQLARTLVSWLKKFRLAEQQSSGC